jgi:hypothetical protein
MKRKCTPIVWASAAFALVTMSGGGAEARIACSNGYQLVQGAWLATPYCQDDLVAQVAHQYGFSASAAAIRNNPNYKRHLCRFIGQDIRIKESCDLVSPHGRVPF